MSIPSAPDTGVQAQSGTGARLWALLAAQLSFGMGWSTFVVQPKFLAQALGAGPLDIGLASAIGPLAGAASIPIGTALIDRLGRKPLLLLGVCCTLAASLGFLAVDSLGPLVFALQALVGASFVFTFNSIIAMATDGAPADRLGRLIGYVAAANMLTNAIGTVTAERLAAAFDWKAVFVFAAGASVTAMVVALRVTDSPRPSRGNEAKVRVLPLLGGPLGAVVLASMLMGSAFVALFTFVQPLALELGLSSVSPFYVAFTTAAVVVRIGFGGLGDRHGRARVSQGALLLYAVATALGAVVTPSLLWPLGAAFGLAHGVAYPTMNALAIERVPEAARGRAITLFNGAFNLGASGGAYGLGLCAEAMGYRAVFLPAASLGVFAFVVLAASAAASTSPPRH